MASPEHGAMVDRAASPSSTDAEVARMKMLRDARVGALLAGRRSSAVRQNTALNAESAGLIASVNGGDSPIRLSTKRPRGALVGATAVSTRRHRS